MFNNPYINTYNPQASIDRINSQIAELERIKSQIPNTPAINQTFQLAPNMGNMKMVKSIDDVQKEFVMSDTAFFSEDLSVMWIKNNKGEIKAYSLAEIIQKDEKDLIIENLESQIKDLKKGKEDEQPNSNNANESA